MFRQHTYVLFIDKHIFCHTTIDYCYLDAVTRSFSFEGNCPQPSPLQVPPIDIAVTFARQRFLRELGRALSGTRNVTFKEEIGDVRPFRKAANTSRNDRQP
ncbi:hypothetical protein NPIL_527621 [Nephila pilipes]|uniref:Uncharacterized protein n=1 Tax=Nephila pilipes TaxID=299642 RepID=A0A8X6NTS1_NEPPI|nr:hypothetical protein NPIL_527621 [Nephila pilipes]